MLEVRVPHFGYADIIHSEIITSLFNIENGIIVDVLHMVVYPPVIKASSKRRSVVRSLGGREDASWQDCSRNETNADWCCFSFTGLIQRGVRTRTTEMVGVTFYEGETFEHLRSNPEYLRWFECRSSPVKFVPGFVYIKQPFDGCFLCIAHSLPSFKLPM